MPRVVNGQCYNCRSSMDEADSFSIRQLLLYFGLMSLLVNVVNPTFLLDIPTSYMLKNILQS